MRGTLLSLMFALVLAAMAQPNAASAFAGASAIGPTLSSAPIVALQQVPDKTIEVNIGEHQTGGGRWYRSPVWIAIGCLAAIVVLLLIVLVARSGGGSGTTIVRQ